MGGLLNKISEDKAVLVDIGSDSGIKSGNFWDACDEFIPTNCSSSGALMILGEK